MIFTPCFLDGVWVIDIEPREDARGLFARTVCQDEFNERGISSEFVQQNVSWNPYFRTLRGLHYQVFPFGEDKLVRATRGSIFDVIVDLRKESETYGKWFSVELSAENRRQLYIPKGFAHGFQTLESNTEILYEMTSFYNPKASAGLRWNSPSLAIEWPFPEIAEKEFRISEADANAPFWQR